MVVVPVAVAQDHGLEVFGPVVFFDAEHEGDHVVVEVEEADIKCLGAHHWLLVVVVCVVVGCFDDDAPFCRHEEVIAYSAGPQPASLRFLDFDDGASVWPVSALGVVRSVATVWS